MLIRKRSIYSLLVTWLSKRSPWRHCYVIRSLSDCNWNRTHNHLVHKRTLNHLAKLVYCVHWNINLPQKHHPLLKTENCPSSPRSLKSIVPYILDFCEPIPEKLDFSVNPHNTKIFYL